ncbi:MAG: hypothetical protein AAFU79_05100 [Myxococcota bacterium]
MSFLGELRRRHVFRVAGLYLVVAWLLLQAANILESSLGLPPWFDGLVVALILLGFPLAMVIAWAFEVTPEGIKLTAPVEGPAPAARPVDIALLVGLVAVTGLIFADRLTGTTQAPSPAPAETDEGPPSIAVLPFVDLSPEGDQGYFADGLSEEILNVLANETDLQVAGRTSSFAFKGKNIDLREVAKTLRVSHVLEGSIRKSGSRIRVTAQLIRADTGYHVFSENYDRELKEVFAVQDDIARRVARAMNLRLSARDRPQDLPIEAYELFLEARDAVHARTKDQLDRGEALVDRVLVLAPDYAEAHALKALVEILLSNTFGTYGSRDPKDTFPKARTHIDRALALNPNLADAHAVLGLLLDLTPEADGDPVAPLDRALELNPNHTNARLWRINVVPKSTASFGEYRALLARDPGFAPAFSGLFNHLLMRGDHEEALALLNRFASVPGSEPIAETYRAFYAFAMGDLSKAYELFQGARARFAGVSGLEAGILLSLGEFERGIESGEPAFAIQAALAQLDIPKALEFAKKARAHPVHLKAVVLTYYAAGDMKAALERFEEVYGSVLKLEDRALVEVEFLLPVLVYLYRTLGKEEEAARALALADEVAARLKRLGYSESSTTRIYLAEVAATHGDVDEAMRILQGFVTDKSPSAIVGPTVMDKYIPPERVKPVILSLWNNTDRERADLGWEPFKRPPLEKILGEK